MKNYILIVFLALLMAGCASTPAPNPELDAAQSRLASLQNNAQVQQHAPDQVDAAALAVSRATSTYREEGSSANFAHQLYVAQRELDITESQTSVNELRLTTEELSERRKALRLEARARRAEIEAALAAEQAAQANTSATLAEQRRLQAESERLAAEQGREAAQAEARLARAEAEQARLELAELRKQLTDMQAKETERGLQLTLQDVLFEFNESALKTGAERQMAKLAEFLEQYPDRQLRIEGFTDSVGSESYNQRLSEQRAESVRSTLISNGVAADRIVTTGYGEQYPLASNDNDAGRQQNRRVEIYISYDDQPVRGRN